MAFVVIDYHLQHWTDLRVPHGSTFWFWIIRHFEVMCTLDMNQDNTILPGYASSVVTKYCPRATVFTKPASGHNLINRRSSGSFANFRLYSRNRFLRACPLVGSRLVVVDKSVGELWFVLRNRSLSSSHISTAATANTELIDGNNSAKKHLNSVWITTEVYRQFSTSFAFQGSSCQRTCSSQYGMSAFR